MKTLHILLPSILFSWSAAAARAQDDVYSPLAVGLRWIADVTMTTPEGKKVQGTAIREITGTEVIRGKTYFVSSTSVEGIPGFKAFKTYRRKTPQGECAISGSDPRKQEYLDTPFPLAVGKSWEVPGAEGRILFKVDAFVAITIGNARYDKCFKISSRSEDAAYSSVFHLAPNIGNVTETTKLGGTTLVFVHRALTRTE